MAADFAGVQGMTPEFSQGGARYIQRFVLAQLGSHFSLAARHQDHGAGFFQQAKGNGIVGGRVTRMQGRDHIHLRRHLV